MKKIIIFLAVMIPLLFANICQAEMTGAQWLNFV
jgi:hypothetical protein